MSDEVVTCSVCGSLVKRSFLQKHELRQHALRKHEKKIICCVCKAHFSFRQQFRDHVSENHGKIESMELKFDSVEGNVLTIFQRNIENIQLSK